MSVTVAQLEAQLRRLKMPPAPKYVPYVTDERALAIRCEENRCAEVDAYYAREGIERTPERILARRVYRDEPTKYQDRKAAYN